MMDHVVTIFYENFLVSLVVVAAACPTTTSPGLERSDVEPFEWLCCVYDDGFPGAPAMQERG